MNIKIAVLWLLLGSASASAQKVGNAPVQLIDPNNAVGRTASTGEGAVPRLAPGANQRALIERYGKIIDQRPIGAGGLTAWTVEKNGRRVVLYTTADGAAIISGVVWESMTGRNLSDQFVPKAVPNVRPPVGGSAAPAPAVVQQSHAATLGAALVGKYSGAIPESIKTIDGLTGIKEGKGGLADTLYIIFDPRCPYCRKAYKFTREYVKRGATIKWIPAVVLQNPQQGAALAASILQATPAQKDDALRRVLGNKEEIITQPTKQTLEEIDRNNSFFFAAFQNNQVEQTGVPAAFFLDKRTGKPRMMTGISELPVIEEVFGKL